MKGFLIWFEDGRIQSTFFAMQAKQMGSLGVAFDVIWFEPKTNSTEDIEATQRAQDFQLGW